jgi:sarcosine oxidase subunit beta
VAGGNLQLNGGVARHDATIWAYAKAARNLNVDIFPFTEVVDIVLKSGVVQGVRTSRGDVETRIVVNAAGAHDRRIAAMAGLDLPTQIYTNEIMVTEPIKPFLPIAVSVPGLSAYMHQSTRGEFVGGAERENKPPGDSMKSSLAGIRDIVRKYVRLYPGLAGVKLMRQWVGIISVTEDHSPILGPVPEIQGFILSVGWGGYGFMGGPGGGKSLAEFILSGEVPLEIQPFNLERFKTGALVKDTALLS